MSGGLTLVGVSQWLINADRSEGVRGWWINAGRSEGVSE